MIFTPFYDDLKVLKNQSLLIFLKKLHNQFSSDNMEEQKMI